VPALVGMFAEFLRSETPNKPLGPIRQFLMSGDWIPTSLPKQLFDLGSPSPSSSPLRLLSLGGATEASIWSNWFEIERNAVKWQTQSIPYGLPMPNQQFYILQEGHEGKGHEMKGHEGKGLERKKDLEAKRFEACPVLVTGELFIGGVGLSLGYLDDPIKTASSFIRHDEFGYLYRTGDLGRWQIDGNIEFMGRKDFQVKIGGTSFVFEFNQH